MYDWVASFAASPHADIILFVIAFAESSFFPIPPDVLLIALAFAQPRRAFRYAAICTVGSVLGGAFGYFLGHVFQGAVVSLMDSIGMSRGFAEASLLYQEYDVMVVGAAAFTVIPYKVFTILAGLFDLDFPRFMVASTLGRGGRFFMVSALIYSVGPKVKPFVEKYMEWIALALVALLIGGFLLLGALRPERPPPNPTGRAMAVQDLRSGDLDRRKEAIRYLLRNSDEFFGFNFRKSPEENADAIHKWENWLEKQDDLGDRGEPVHPR
jgi:membrane protein YqaA with SNARE-associated domain